MNLFRTAALSLVLCFMTFLNAFAQQGGSGGEVLSKSQFLPKATYEVKYWTDMTGRSREVEIDTMYFFGNDRAASQYTSSHSVSAKYAASDSLVYVLAPKLGMGEKEWIMGNNYVKRMNRSTVPFKGFDRSVYRVYVSSLDHKDDGRGEYMLVSNQFGIIYRYNNRGDIWMLNRIDVVRDGKVMDEIDLLPLQMDLGRTEIFRVTEQ
jgi:hypothetical protein